MSKKYTRTDLAIEKGRADRPKSSASETKKRIYGKTVLTESTAWSDCEMRAVRYVTISRDGLWNVEGDAFEMLTTLIASEIRKMSKQLTGKEIDRDFRVLIAGLGNSDITPDAIGPLTVKNLTVTRHLKFEAPEVYGKMQICEISALSPGVLGQTGIETVELIRGAADTSSPDLIVAVDALAARSCDRLAATVQLSDAGIQPGSGIGNTRKAITSESVGVPVVSIGVPTVVDSSTLVYDVLRKAGIKKISPEVLNVLENGKNFFVSPKESDLIAKKVSEMLAESIHKAYLCPLKE
ncbi:MAG: GPR endopeptidase [Eubacteriales bacterium]